jgi:hypothetical protein
VATILAAFSPPLKTDAKVSSSISAFMFSMLYASVFSFRSLTDTEFFLIFSAALRSPVEIFLISKTTSLIFSIVWSTFALRFGVSLILLKPAPKSTNLGIRVFTRAKASSDVVSDLTPNATVWKMSLN